MLRGPHFTTEDARSRYGVGIAAPFEGGMKTGGRFLPIKVSRGSAAQNSFAPTLTLPPKALLALAANKLPVLTPNNPRAPREGGLVSGLKHATTPFTHAFCAS